MLYDKEQAHKQHGVALQRKYKVSRIGLRTRWFDQGVLDALGLNTHPLPVAVTLTLNDTHDARVTLSLRPPARQVVLLAAGMDARAWRLPLDDTPVFELDMPDVVAAKATMLQRLRVQTAVGQEGCAYPLRASRWTSMAADLTDPSWGGLLQAGGFDPTRPCVCTWMNIVDDGLLSGIKNTLPVGYTSLMHCVWHNTTTTLCRVLITQHNALLSTHYTTQGCWRACSCTWMMRKQQH